MFPLSVTSVSPVLSREVVPGELFRLGSPAAVSAVRVHVLTVPVETLPVSVDRLQDSGPPHVLVGNLSLSCSCHSSTCSCWWSVTCSFHLFRSKVERGRILKGTGVPEAVDTDLTNICSEYTDVVLPFIAKHPDLWNPSTHTLELYTQLVAFVMAYRSVSTNTHTHVYNIPALCVYVLPVSLCSFQEPQEDEEVGAEEEEEEEEKAPNPPMMVPMADMLNHVSNHNANLEFTPVSSQFKTEGLLLIWYFIVSTVSDLWKPTTFLFISSGRSENGLRPPHSQRWGGVQHLRANGQLAAAAHVRLHRTVSKQQQRHGRHPLQQPLQSGHTRWCSDLRVHVRDEEV